MNICLFPYKKVFVEVVAKAKYLSNATKWDAVESAISYHQCSA